MKTTLPPYKWLLIAIMCCISIAAKAAISISGDSPIGEHEGYPLFHIQSPWIDVSLPTYAKPPYSVTIDDLDITDITWVESSTGITVDVSHYTDAQPHKLQITGTSNYGSLYFIFNGDNPLEGVFYNVIYGKASVIGSMSDIEKADIMLEYEHEGILYPVTSIEKYAFYGRSSLTDVTIPEGVESIHYTAFKDCSSLATLSFNAKNCNNASFPSSINSLTFGDKVTRIPERFLGNGSHVENITIPNSVTEIPNGAFMENSYLKSLTIGAGVKVIAASAFKSCNITKAFWLGNTPPEGASNVTAAIHYAANNDYRNRLSSSTYYIYPFLSSKFEVKGVVYVPVSPSERTCDAIDCSYNPDITDVTISNKVSNLGIELTVNDIQKYSFYKNQYVQNLSITNNGLIGDSCFYECSALASVKVSNQGNIGLGAFYNCSNIQTANISNQGNIDRRAFYECSNIQTVDISNHGDIGEEAFYGCSKLLTANISNHGNIGERAFYMCSRLRAASISNHGNIGKQAFDGLTGLTDLTLGQEVTAILDYAFGSCSAITNLSIPNSVTELGEGTFQYCKSLQRVQIGNGVTNLPIKTFASCSSLHSLTIPNNIQSIENNVFSGCSSLADIIIEDSNGPEEQPLELGYNTSIYTTPKGLFNDCPLENIYIGRKLSYYSSEKQGYSPFYGNTSLKSVEISDAETRIYRNEFYGCSGLKSLKIGNGVESIGARAFSGCSSLDYFSAGIKLESIGEEAFSDCIGLEKFYSYSVNPPICGNQALDDINKWECTLYVPANSSDAYKAAPQWKDFFFSEEMTEILVTEIRLNTSEVSIGVGQSFQLTAKISPSHADNQTLIFASSNPEYATVDANGLISALKEGTSTISVKSADGNSEATCLVTVTTEAGINDATLNASNGVYYVFNLQGILVLMTHDPEDIKWLPAGLYIINGKKIAIQ